MVVVVWMYVCTHCKLPCEHGTRSLSLSLFLCDHQIRIVILIMTKFFPLSLSLCVSQSIHRISEYYFLYKLGNFSFFITFFLASAFFNRSINYSLFIIYTSCKYLIFLTTNTKCSSQMKMSVIEAVWKTGEVCVFWVIKSEI